MMTIDGIFAQLNGLIERREWIRWSLSYQGCMENASELKINGIYYLGNDFWFLRETGRLRRR